MRRVVGGSWVGLSRAPGSALTVSWVKVVVADRKDCEGDVGRESWRGGTEDLCMYQPTRPEGCVVMVGCLLSETSSMWCDQTRSCCFALAVRNIASTGS